MTSPVGILQLLSARGIGVQSLNRVLDAFRREGGTLEDLAAARPDELIARAGLRPQLAEAVAAARPEAARLAEQLAAQGIRVLVKGLGQYPSSLTAVLGETAPPVLFARGDLDILSLPGVGFAGSRKSSPRGLAIAGAAARELAQRGANIVSGYANGVDLAAHRAALEAGGATTLVLAEGILHFRVKSDLADVLEHGCYLVLSEFPPGLKWLARNAMQRNRTICGLSRALVVVESGLNGGTFAAAQAAQEIRLPLFVVEFASPPPGAEGNGYFLQRGAQPLRSNGSGDPNLVGVLSTVGLSQNGAGEPKPQQPEVRNGTPTGEAEPAPEGELHESMDQHPQPSNPDGYRRYPNRLIEVDLPIARISAHARREKSIRHGHISTLHIWWARRPLAACRAVLCAALWPDPADPLCPPTFRDAAARLITEFARKIMGKGEKIGTPGLRKTCSPESHGRWEKVANGDVAFDPGDAAHQNVLRFALLDFIADFANWDNSTVPEYLETARALTQAAHESLGGEPGTRPLVVDPFAGGGSIPLEALRVGADAFASDLNPVAVLLNKVVLEYIPRYGQRLADEVHKWGAWIKEQAEKELAKFYPKDPDGATPVAYLWARTITCEGPGCGVELPLMRSLWLAKKGNRSVALRLVPRPQLRRVDFEIVEDAGAKDVAEATVRRGSATCPVCGFTTPVASVRRQLKERRGGTADARLLCVITTRVNQAGVAYRLPTEGDSQAVRQAQEQLAKRKKTHKGALELVPDEPTPEGGGTGAGRAFSQRHYGMDRFEDLFTPRQQLVLCTLAGLIGLAGEEVSRNTDSQFGAAMSAALSMALGKLTDFSSSLCTWRMTRSCVRGTFTRQALPITWDFGEMNPFAGSAGDWDEACRYVGMLIDDINRASVPPGQAQLASATNHPLPDGIASAFVTDPPYYDAVPYADLSNYFYVWHRRALQSFRLEILANPLSAKEDEAIMDPASRSREGKPKDAAFYVSAMRQAMANGCRILDRSGIGIVVFAHKSTSGWEAILQSVVDAGWVVTGSWPVDTERPGRLRSQDSAALASSVHLVCRPRVMHDVGEWRDVLAQLPKRIHEWMPRLDREGIVGADAIFACLGPALEIFSRYSRVEKASGELATLREYLEHVWGAVSTEALSMIFKDADAARLEPDARVTAMWLWTLGGGVQSTTSNGRADPEEESEPDEEPAEEEQTNGKVAKTRGYTLEFDAARKIAQGLGVHLERCASILEVKGDKARLLSVAERTCHLFGKETDPGTGAAKRGKKKPQQKSLFDELNQAEATETARMGHKGPPPGTTALDRLHQAMILFAGGRGEVLKRFLVDDGIGKDARLWKLAQSLSALYPAGSDEKRWVDGVLARKKGLGL
jgi:putative DNA methylase